MIHSKPLITIVLPCYNVEKYIHRGLESIFAQTFTNWEALLIDDGSTDNTGKICDDYTYKDSRFIVVHTKNNGVSFARNEGIKRATGRLLYFMDPDDYIEKDLLEKCYAIYINNKVDIIKFHYKSEWEDGTPSWVMNGDTPDGLYSREQIFTDILHAYIGTSINDVSLLETSHFWDKREYGAVWRMMYRLDFLRENNLQFDCTVKLNEDGMFNCYAISHASSIYVMSDALYTYTIRNAGAMSRLIKDFDEICQTKIKFLQCREDIRKKHLTNSGIDLFPLYGGSLFLSVMELLVKGSDKLSNFNSINKYINHKAVKKSIDLIPLKGNIKIIISLILLRLRFAHMLFFICWLLRKIHILK